MKLFCEMVQEDLAVQQRLTAEQVQHLTVCPHCQEFKTQLMWLEPRLVNYFQEQGLTVEVSAKTPDSPVNENGQILNLRPRDEGLSLHIEKWLDSRWLQAGIVAASGVFAMLNLLRFVFVMMIPVGS